MIRPTILLGVLLAGCRGEPPGAASPLRLDQLVDSLRPAVESAVGLAFLRSPRSEYVSKDAVRSYLLARVEKEYPPSRLEGIQAGYRLLALLPDTLDLLRLLLELYEEQVAGYYDPDSARLYAVRGSDPVQLRLVMAHEMVHALQHQYLPLDTLMGQRGDGDRLAAAQAVLEGHATVASARILTPGRDVIPDPAFWETYREQIRNQQRTMPVFASAPLVLREGLIFPYLAGAEFVRWWLEHRKTPLPRREELPQSTEQILHSERYASGDAPLAVRFTDSTETSLLEDTLGEMEVQVLLAVLRGADGAATAAPLGWGGDRLRVFRTDGGPGLVWYSVWDRPQFAERFARQTSTGFTGHARPGYRLAVEQVTVSGRPGVRLVHAPIAWRGWERLPKAEIR